MDRSFRPTQDREALDRERVAEKHARYSECMYLIHAWHQSHGQGAADAFRQGVHADDPQALRLNVCRSMTKDFWRDVLFLHQQGTQVPFGAEHHARFVAAVKPLDDALKGHGASSKDMVYSGDKFFAPSERGKQ